MNNPQDLKRPTIYTGRSTSDPEKTPNEFGQRKLLKALSEGVEDPQELARISGMGTTAAVIVALDRLSLRKDWHSAMASAGLDLDFLAGKIKQLADSKNERISLNAVKTALSSVGLNEFKEDGVSVKNWEEVISEAVAKRRSGAIEAEFRPAGQYEVKEPEIPKSIKEKWEEERKEADDLYDKK